MAGEAKTNAFLLSTATVMIGPTADLFKLHPASHSIGLVKNFQMIAEPSYTELTQGVKNNIVFSTLTSNPVRCSMEAYEFTAKNLAYGLGLDGSSLDLVAAPLLTNASIAAAATTALLADAGDTSEDFTAGTWVMIQEAGSDRVHVAKLSGNATHATGVTTLTFTGFPTPADVTFAAGSKVFRVNRIDVGSKAEQPFLGAKIIGILPEGNKPIAILIPKIRITKGFALAFQSDQYGNLPFEFTPYELVSTDTFYSEFVDKGVAAVFPGI